MKQEEILSSVMNQFCLPRDGLHGPNHWARVLETARRLSRDLDVEQRVIELFALLHDSQRVCDGLDRDHGRRAADLAWRLRRSLGLADDKLDLLRRALAGHGDTASDPGDDTIRVCWDAERLDLARLGITPRPACLFTEAARDPDTIVWACERSNKNYAPREILAQWGLEKSAFHATAP